MSVQAAIKARDPTALPSKRDEDWRWTDLRGLIRSVPEPSPAGDPTRLGVGPWGAASERVILNGRALNGDELVIRTGDHHPVALRFVSQASDTAHHKDLRIVVEPDARLVLLESYEGQGSNYLASTALSIEVGKGAWVERFVLTDDAADAVSVSVADVRLGADAVFKQTVIAGGAKRQRIETRLSHPGEGASVRLDGVYLLDKQRHADITTVVTHAGPYGITSQMTKGVVRDQARGVFQGRIVVAEGADQTEARMEHHALILSERAEVDAKPELEIFADDVVCSHGNTVGALDEDALFYARQRGIPEAEARALLTEAFIGEVIDRIDPQFAAVDEIVRRWTAERLRSA